MRTTYLTLVFTLSVCLSFAQNFTISGFIEDASNGENLIGANVFDANTFKGTSSNVYGFYSLTLPKGNILLTSSFIGFEKNIIALDLQKDTVINFKMSSSNTLKEVEVTAEKTEKIQESAQMSTMSIPIQTIEKLPMLMGEVDVVKALQLLPGVQSGSEGSSGLYVRGGGPDQNLILLDGVPVYNASHLFGFFSVFNPDGISSVELIKGGFPAQYGGRLSSIIDIRMKEGNMKEFHGTGSLGIISSKLTLEGPIVKDKASFIISGRRTYIDLLARPLIKRALKQEGTDGVLGYYFYDLNGKINWKISDKDRIFFSVYTGQDNFYMRIKETYELDSNDVESEIRAGLDWGNLTSALRYNRILTNKLFMNLTATYTSYDFNINQEFAETYIPDNNDQSVEYISNYLSSIQDWAGKLDFDYLVSPNQTIRFGASNIYHTYKPGANAFKYGNEENGIDTTIGARNIFAHEYYAYVADEFKLGARLKANVGVHFSGFKTSKANYYSFQPRISTRFLLSEFLSLKASYAEMQQYNHLLSNSSIGLPTDLWVPSTETVKPQYSRQIAIGLARTFKEEYEISIEGYYKKMDNLIEYKSGASFFNSTDDWSEKIEFGQGWSYGLELFVQKKFGKTNGWIGYTLSWNNRQFDNLNDGKPFPYRYDRRHDASIVISHEINDNLNLSGAWVYGTGNAVTLPLESYIPAARPFQYQGIINHFDERNGYRMRAYHRLDLAINWSKEKKLYTRTWSFGTYNTYSRQNPFFLSIEYGDSFDPSDGNGRKLYQYSLFPIIPYLAYSFKF